MTNSYIRYLFLQSFQLRRFHLMHVFYRKLMKQAIEMSFCISECNKIQSFPGKNFCSVLLYSFILKFVIIRTILNIRQFVSQNPSNN